MRRHALLAALALSLAASAAVAQPSARGPEAVVARMTEAVNRGDMPTAVAAFAPNAWIVDDLAPYVWRGPGAAQAWIASMGANAQAQAINVINMKLSPATRVEVVGERAYVLLPGRLSYTMKDGHSERADGVLTFTLQRTAGDWKIDTLVWSGPVATR